MEGHEVADGEECRSVVQALGSVGLDIGVDACRTPSTAGGCTEVVSRSWLGEVLDVPPGQTLQAPRSEMIISPMKDLYMTLARPGPLGLRS